MGKFISKRGANADCQPYDANDDTKAVLLRFSNYSGGIQISCGADLSIEDAREFAKNIVACCDEMERQAAPVEA